MTDTLRLDAHRKGFGWLDLLAFGALCAVIYAIVAVAREWSGPLRPTAEIELAPQHLLAYSAFSLARGVLAYGVSFLFTLVYGYAMARIPGTERVLLPLLDILQSIPVLGFLPGLVIGLVHLFPRSNTGLELASVLMIFTGQVWNMTFSFYGSLKAIPADYLAVAHLARLTWWQRFTRVELAYAAPGLVWNSMISMAGGWFFLTVSESFVLGEHDFRLPGLGAYMSVAIERGDVAAQLMGVLAMSAVIVLVDRVVWNPITIWAQRFSDSDPGAAKESWFWSRVGRSRMFTAIHAVLTTIVSTASRPKRVNQRLNDRQRPMVSPAVRTTARWIVIAMTLSLLGYGALRYAHLIATLSRDEWLHLLVSASMTLGRVTLAVLLATLWAVPAGVALGTRPHLSRILQPVIQMVASFPAPMIFPVVVGIGLSMGVGLGWSSVPLLMLGTQWYVLFNVVAGAGQIPRDLVDAAHLARLDRWTRWKTLVLPAIFPSLLTGWITAFGGAWNASIVAEYMKYRGATLTTTGLGSAISRATEQGDFHVLAAAVGLMAVSVVTLNRLVWRPLTNLAQNRFSLGT